MNQSITDIKSRLEKLSIDEIPDALKEYADDERSGVKSIIKSYERKVEKHKQELERLKKLRLYENQYEHLEYIAGIDEVGRGPFAGPVVTAAVILPKDFMQPYINDSKKLSEEMREKLFDIIMENAIGVGIGIVQSDRIDEINILQATYEAMRQAVETLAVKPQQLLVDAVHIPGINIPQASIVKGDEKSISIAAASIIAKVTRDRMMIGYDELFPGYQFAKNKGYGTSEHIEALKKIGPCPIHRRSFIKNFVNV